MADYIKASTKLAMELKKMHLTARQKAFADLVSLGWKDKDAYQIVGLFNSLINPTDAWKEMRTLIQNPDFQAYHPESRTSTIAPSKPTKKVKTEEEEMTDDDINDLLSKDRQLRDLAKKLKYEDLDPKTEMDVRKMIADLQNFKKEQVTEDDKKLVLFYAPMKCYKCALYLNAKKHHKD